MHPLKWLRAHVAHEWVNIVAALIVAAATVAYTFVAYRQWRTMRDQLAEMRSSSEQTAATIAVLREQATALKTQLSLLQESNRISETASRAWLTTETFAANVDLETSSYPDLRVDVTNVGRQPAENVRFNIHLDYGEMSEVKNADPDTFPVWSKHADELAWEQACKNALPQPGTTMVYPSNASHVSFSRFDHNIDLREIRARRKLLVFWGCLGYRTLGTIHRTSFCVYLNPVAGRSIHDWSYDFCPAGNHAD